jgi:hypothetical protein
LIESGGKRYVPSRGAFHQGSTGVLKSIVWITRVSPGPAEVNSGAIIEKRYIFKYRSIITMMKLDDLKKHYVKE